MWWQRGVNVKWRRVRRAFATRRAAPVLALNLPGLAVARAPEGAATRCDSQGRQDAQEADASGGRHYSHGPFHYVPSGQSSADACHNGFIITEMDKAHVNDIDMDMCTHVAQPARLVGLHVPPPTTPFALWCLDPCSPAVPWADKCH